jgi:hypothetical protein
MLIRKSTFKPNRIAAKEYFCCSFQDSGSRKMDVPITWEEQVGLHHEMDDRNEATSFAQTDSFTHFFERRFPDSDTRLCYSPSWNARKRMRTNRNTLMWCSFNLDLVRTGEAQRLPVTMRYRANQWKTRSRLPLRSVDDSTKCKESCVESISNGAKKRPGRGKLRDWT